jgi:hypothetical protein
MHVRRRRCRLRRVGARRHTAQAHGFLAFLDLEFGKIRFLENVDQFFDFPQIHGVLARSKPDRVIE